MANYQIHELTSGTIDRDSNVIHDTLNGGNYETRKATAGAVADLANVNVAALYDPDTTYAIGQYCLYEGDIYRCIAITTGAFDSTKWTQIVVTGEFRRVVELTSAQYAQLTPAEQNNGTIYIKTDEETTAADIPYSAGVSVADKIDDMTTYSTTEKVVGKWVDNKPIYRKYISGSITDGDTLVSGVDTFISAFGVVYIASVGRLIPYYEYFQGASYGATVRKVGTNITASILSNNSSSSAGQSNLFIDYTKA